MKRAYAWGGNGQDLIDIPCGAGALSMRLRELGFTVTCCDIDPGNFEAAGFRHLQADLDQSLPLGDRSFDVVVSVAGIQRISSPEMAIAEFHRILKPGGILYLAVPNCGDLRTRFRFLLYGSLGPLFDSPCFQQTTKSPEADCRFPLMVPRVECMVREAGFEVLAVQAKSRDLFPYIFLPFSLAACAASWLRSTLDPRRFGNYRRSTTMGMLGAKVYLIVARKPAPAG